MNFDIYVFTKVYYSPTNAQVIVLTLILLTWKIWWAPNNANRW